MIKIFSTIIMFYFISSSVFAEEPQISEEKLPLLKLHPHPSHSMKIFDVSETHKSSEEKHLGIKRSSKFETFSSIIKKYAKEISASLPIYFYDEHSKAFYSPLKLTYHISSLPFLCCSCESSTESSDTNPTSTNTLQYNQPRIISEWELSLRLP